jgi:hypothetical protein
MKQICDEKRVYRQKLLKAFTLHQISRHNATKNHKVTDYLSEDLLQNICRHKKTSVVRRRSDIHQTRGHLKAIMFPTVCVCVCVYVCIYGPARCSYIIFILLPRFWMENKIFISITYRTTRFYKDYMEKINFPSFCQPRKSSVWFALAALVVGWPEYPAMEAVFSLPSFAA